MFNQPGNIPCYSELNVSVYIKSRKILFCE